MGLNSMWVWVLADNPAGQFYAALGGQKVEQKELAIEGHLLIEVAYGWINTQSRISREGPFSADTESMS
jgi:hypothetical protein